MGASNNCPFRAEPGPYIASKRRYLYGLRIHALVTAYGEPVESEDVS